jgi:hypothetical protein
VDVVDAVDVSVVDQVAQDRREKGQRKRDSDS